MHRKPMWLIPVSIICGWRAAGPITQTVVGSAKKRSAFKLKQDVIFRGAPADATYQFSAGFDDKTGNFRIISKKKVLSKAE